MELKTAIMTWDSMSKEEKKHRLFLNQKEILDKFLARGAISRAQYEKSLSDMTAHMGETL